MATKTTETLINNDNLSLSKITITYSDGKVITEFWLYDKVWRGNLSMRAKDERSAFVETIQYHQQRNQQLSAELKSLRKKVDSFLSQFNTEYDVDGYYPEPCNH